MRLDRVRSNTCHVSLCFLLNTRDCQLLDDPAARVRCVATRISLHGRDELIPAFLEFLLVRKGIVSWEVDCQYRGRRGNVLTQRIARWMRFEMRMKHLSLVVVHDYVEQVQEGLVVTTEPLSEKINTIAYVMYILFLLEFSVIGHRIPIHKESKRARFLVLDAPIRSLKAPLLFKHLEYLFQGLAGIAI